MKNSKFQRLRLALLTLSTVLFPFTFYYLSPVISLYGSSLGIISGSLIVFFIQFLLSIFLGRSFCSWLCPVGGIQDQIGQSRTKRIKATRIAWMKYVVWAIWLTGILFFFRKAGGVQGIEMAFATEKGLSTTSVQALIAYGAVVLTFIAISLLFGRRGGCHSICWMAPFMVIGRKIGLALNLPSLQLKSNRQSCTACGRCDKVCPMSLEVKKMVALGGVRDNSCILCGNCKDICSKNTLQWAWRAK